jgi:hypothetical protein
MADDRQRGVKYSRREGRKARGGNDRFIWGMGERISL